MPPLEPPGNSEAERYRWVEMAARNRADRIGHSQNREPEGKGDAGKTNPHRRKGGGQQRTATAAEYEPECADQLGRKFLEHCTCPQRHSHDSDSRPLGCFGESGFRRFLTGAVSLPPLEADLFEEAHPAGVVEIAGGVKTDGLFGIAMGNQIGAGEVFYPIA